MASRDLGGELREALRRLTDQHPRDEALYRLAMLQQEAEITGGHDYMPEWLMPLVVVAAQILVRERGHELAEGEIGGMAEGMLPIVLYAAQLGYTEGFFAAKDD